MIYKELGHSGVNISPSRWEAMSISRVESREGSMKILNWPHGQATSLKGSVRREE